MKNKLLYSALVLLNLAAIYVMIEYYSADYLFSNVDGAELKASTKSGSMFVIITIFCNLVISAAIMFTGKVSRD